MDFWLPLLSTSSSSSSPHHVFPSFHGPDVRRNLLYHVLEKFKSKGINTFVDNDMERGKTISHELKEAIIRSKIAIVLLSKNYASSTWCLNELELIMECREKLGQTVIPIFYEVDPTDIRKQTRDFGKVFKKNCKGKKKEDIRRWKHVLTEVAQITGHHSTKWKNDVEMIEDIATDVSNKLNNYAPSSDFDSLLAEIEPRRDILKSIYDALCDEDKLLFLYIACLFNRERVDIVEGCLASCFSDVTQGLHILAEKSLIDVNWGIINMHNLLVQLGRKIFREQSDSEPGKRQFLIDAVDIGDVLNDDKPGSSSVLGINDLDGNITCTSERAFERLSNLQFLRISSNDINPQSLNSISGKLRFLSWRKYGMTCLHSSFNPKFLVNLNMQYSKLVKLWEETQQLSNLKWMNLSQSKRLEELPDLSFATNLYELRLCGCSSLVKLPSSIGDAINLQKLDLGGCSSLVKLPSSIGDAISNLQELDLSGCSSLVKFSSSIGDAINLQKLDLSGCSSLVKLPSSIGDAINLQELDLCNCSSLVKLPSSMRNLRRLSTLELRGCSKLEVVLANINLECLEELNLSECFLLKSDPESSTNIQDLNPSGTTVTEAPSKSEMCEIQELGPWIGRISFLRRLVLRGMKNLVSLPQLPYSVLELEAYNCESLERLDCSFRNPDIRFLNFGNCFKLNQEARDLIIRMPTNEYAVLPGGEVPQCFTYRSSGGSLIMQLNQNHRGTSTRFKACIVYAGEVSSFRKADISCSIKSKENALTSIKAIGQVFPGNLYTFEVEAEEVTSTELVFEFEFHSCFDVEFEIKECGIIQILEVPSVSRMKRKREEDIEAE